MSPSDSKVSFSKEEEDAILHQMRAVSFTECNTAPLPGSLSFDPTRLTTSHRDASHSSLRHQPLTRPEENTYSAPVFDYDDDDDDEAYYSHIQPTRAEQALLADDLSRSFGRSLAPYGDVDLAGPGGTCVQYLANLAAFVDEFRDFRQELKDTARAEGKAKADTDIQRAILTAENSLQKDRAIANDKVNKETYAITDKLTTLHISITNREVAIEARLEEKRRAQERLVRDCVKTLEDERDERERVRLENARRIREAEEAERVRLDTLRREKEEREQKEKADRERKEKEAEEKRSAEKAKADRSAADKAKRSEEEVRRSANYGSPTARAEYVAAIDAFAVIQPTVIAPVQADPQLRRLAFDARRHITRPLGQITNARPVIRRIIQELDATLRNAAASGPLLAQWALHATARSILAQVTTEVEANPAAAYPLARVTLALLSLHPPLVPILRAHLTHACPYIVPLYVERTQGQSLDDHLRLSAWAKKPLDTDAPPGSDPGWESMESYQRRMASIIALYAAILQTKPMDNTPNPFGMPQAWEWLARLLNLPPRRVTPALLIAFLEVAGPALVETYKGQARKLLRFLLHDYIHRIPPESVAHTVRLCNWLEEWDRTQRVPVSKAREMDR